MSSQNLFLKNESYLLLNPIYNKYIIITYSFRVTLMVFHGSLSDSKPLQVSRTLLSILAVLNNAVVWVVSTRPPTSKSSCPINSPLVLV